MMSSQMRIYHRAVLVKETLWALDMRPGGRYIDATVGEGGHAEAILDGSAPGGKVLGIDADAQVLAGARQRLDPYAGSFVPVQGNYADLGMIAHDHEFTPVHGILLDLGLSSFQLERGGRGFSFLRDEPLDMRFSQDQPVTAADIVNTYPLKDLARLIAEFGEEPRAIRIARAVVANRPVRTARELGEVVLRAAGYRGGRTHPATRTFQALRIAVNDELTNLKFALDQAVPLLGQGGRLVVISYHSLEDRIVKERFRREKEGALRPVTRKVITPSSQEIQENRRSRSARLRAAERR